jgi:hypothetical protein
MESIRVMVYKTPPPPEPPWVPSGTPYARYDASQITGLSDDDPVTTWEDLSGNDYDLAAGAAPTYKTNIQNSLPAVYFNSDYLSYSLPAISQPNTYFMVFKLGNTSDGVMMTGTVGGLRNSIYIEGGVFKLYAGGIYNGPSVDTDAHIMVARFNSTSSYIRIDGVQHTTGNASGQSLSGLTLGANYDTGNRKLMHVMELIIYNGPEDHTYNESGLSEKWGISLPIE